MPKQDKNTPDSTDYLKMIGARVRAIRARRGMSRKILASDSTVSERYLGQLESGQGNISINLLRRIADAMSVSVIELLHEEPERSFEQNMVLQLLERLDGAQIDEVHKILMAQFSSAADKNKANRIALLGLRGAGKTTLGKKLADHLGMSFVDIGSEIEILSGMSLGEIFSLYGQQAYRRYERQALEKIVSDKRRMVIETGGSIVSEPASLSLLFENCTTIWIKTTPEEHIARVIAQGDHRPLAGPDDQVMEDLKQILTQRAPLYARADFQIDNSGRSIEQSFSELSAIIPNEA